MNDVLQISHTIQGDGILSIWKVRRTPSVEVLISGEVDESSILSVVERPSWSSEKASAHAKKILNTKQRILKAVYAVIGFDVRCKQSVLERFPLQRALRVDNPH